MAFNEKPPMLTGNQQSDMVRMRDYLFRMANSLDAIASAPAVYTGTSNPALSGSSSADSKSEIDKIRKSAQELRDLIIQNANNISYITQYTSENGGLWQKISSQYLAKSAYGDLEEYVDTQIAALPGKIEETYQYLQRINGLSSEVSDYFTQMNGQIRRGFIENPDYPDSSSDRYLFGIAISSNLQFEADVRQLDGTHDYYHLASGQTFGFYTSKGWQFWINGYKSGWFDSSTNMLHVRRVVADELLQISGKWQIRVIDGGLGLEFVYIGS